MCGTCSEYCFPAGYDGDAVHAQPGMPWLEGPAGSRPRLDVGQSVSLFSPAGEVKGTGATPYTRLAGTRGL